MAKKKIYKQEFYKQLSAQEKELIYKGAMQLAAGCLAFETTIAGAPMMAGRLGVVQAMMPWFVRIATDAAKITGIIDLSRINPTAAQEIDEDITTTENEEKDPQKN